MSGQCDFSVCVCVCVVGRQDRSQNGKWESGCAVSLLPPNDKACLVSLGEMSPFSVRSSTTMEQSSRVSELKNQRLHVWKILSVRDILGLFLPPSRWLCCASRSLSISILTLSLSLSLPLSPLLPSLSACCWGIWQRCSVGTCLLIN